MSTILALGLSGGSLAALSVLGVFGFEAKVSAAEPTLADIFPDRESGASSPAPALLAEATIPLQPVAPALANATSSTVAMVAVPDVSGLRLWIARKRLSDAGLKMVPREGTRRVFTAEYPDFQVAEASEFGQAVPAGSAVRVDVEYWTPRFAQAY